MFAAESAEIGRVAKAERVGDLFGRKVGADESRSCLRGKAFRDNAAGGTAHAASNGGVQSIRRHTESVGVAGYRPAIADMRLDEAAKTFWERRRLHGRHPVLSRILSREAADMKAQNRQMRGRQGRGIVPRLASFAGERPQRLFDLGQNRSKGGRLNDRPFPETMSDPIAARQAAEDRCHGCFGDDEVMTAGPRLEV